MSSLPVKALELRRAADIAGELEKSEAWKAKGWPVVATASLLLSALPAVGGPLSYLVDKVGTHLLEPNLSDKLIEIANLVAALEPDIMRVSSREERFEDLAATVTTNASLLARLESLLALLNSGIQEPTLRISTTAATQLFSEIAIDRMKVVAEAHMGGLNYFKGVHTRGNGVHFIATGGARQVVERSTFSGPTGSIGMNNLSLQGNVRTSGNGVSLGPGAVISFGPNGSLTFGGPKK